MINKEKIIFLLFIFLITFSCSSGDINKENMRNDFNKDITLKEKIAQMIMVRVDGGFYNKDSWKKKYLTKLVKEYKIGGFITFGGSIHGTYSNIKFYQEISKTPLFIAADYERGLGTFIDGTLFPPNMALAATGNSEYAFKQGEIIAEEALSIGVNMIFAPVVDINNNPKNPIINIRSYGDDALTVEKYSIPFIKGLQSKNIISCSKHYPGHGNTSTDSHTSLPIINISKEDFIKNELYPFKKACESNVRGMMIGHILIPSLDSEYPATFSKKITENILRNELNYKGLIITDALEMGALTSTTWHGESAIRAIEAGADILLLPLDAVQAIDIIYNAVNTGRIEVSRIDESYNRIIDEKNKLGLFEKEYPKWESIEQKIGIKKHTGVASDIAEESITLVKNNKGLVPFIPQKYKKITHIMMSTDNDLRQRLKSFSRDISYIHGNVNEIYVNDPLSSLGLEDVLNKINNTELVVVSMLIRISMDKGIATIDESHNQLLKEIYKKNIPMIGLSFGSPYLPDYGYFDSYLCTYGYGSISFNAATNALFGRKDISGKLPITLNSKYKAGDGITLKKKINSFINTKNKYDLSESIKIVEQSINDKIFPGAQIFVSIGDDIVLNKGFGNFTYENNSKRVTEESVFDIASLTKVLATVPVVMKLVQRKKIDLDFPLSDFYPEFYGDIKSKITIRHLLTHTSGLKPYIEYYKKDGFSSRDAIIKDIINQDLDYTPDSKVVYSDLGMILLYDIIEMITNTPFEKTANKYYYNPLGMNNTFFNPNENIKHNIVPTEKDDYFRNRLLKGEVHDENTFLLGGVSGHAGLFSSASDIAKMSKMLLDGGIYLGRRHLKRNIVDKFTERVNIPVDSDRTIGWDTPSQRGDSSAGDYFSKKTYGHLGFTGTSLWIDPENNIIVIVLTNRVYPNRNNSNIYKFRREFHNSLIKNLREIE